MKIIISYLKWSCLVLCLQACSTKSDISVSRDSSKARLAKTQSTLNINEQDTETRGKDEIIQDVKDEIVIGKGMAAKLLGTFGYYDNIKANKYVNLIGQSLIRKIGRPEIKYYFAVLDVDDVNAFAAPGGYIFVTKGLLLFCLSESELAGVLAHEIAHVNQKHMYKGISVKHEVSVGENLTRILSRGGSDLSSSLSKTITKGMKILLDDGLTHADEYDADAVGVIYSLMSGYNPTSLKDFLARLQFKHDALMSKTHPPFLERIARIQKNLDENNLTSQMTANENNLQYRFNLYLKGTHK